MNLEHLINQRVAINGCNGIITKVKFRSNPVYYGIVVTITTMNPYFSSSHPLNNSLTIREFDITKLVQRYEPSLDLTNNINKGWFSYWFNKFRCSIGFHDYVFKSEYLFDIGEIWSGRAKTYRCRRCGKLKVLDND